VGLSEQALISAWPGLPGPGGVQLGRERGHVGETGVRVEAADGPGRYGHGERAKYSLRRGWVRPAAALSDRSVLWVSGQAGDDIVSAGVVQGTGVRAAAGSAALGHMA
jgi:hypothetical protein